MNNNKPRFYHLIKAHLEFYQENSQLYPYFKMCRDIYGLTEHQIILLICENTSSEKD